MDGVVQEGGRGGRGGGEELPPAVSFCVVSCVLPVTEKRFFLFFSFSKVRRRRLKRGVLTGRGPFRALAEYPLTSGDFLKAGNRPFPPRRRVVCLSIFGREMRLCRAASEWPMHGEISTASRKIAQLRPVGKKKKGSRGGFVSLDLGPPCVRTGVGPLSLKNGIDSLVVVVLRIPLQGTVLIVLLIL